MSDNAMGMTSSLGFASRHLPEDLAMLIRGRGCEQGRTTYPRRDPEVSAIVGRS
jgi:hypothetical protein